MSKELPPEIKQQIEQESDVITARMNDRNDYEAGKIKGFEEGYIKAGEIYAPKWQEEKELRERYEKALIKIVSLSCGVDNRNAILELKSIASMAVAKETKALTPKTSSDDTAHG